MRRPSLLASLTVWTLAPLLLAGCIESGQAGAYVGVWGDGDETLLIRRNGLAEGRLFGAAKSRTFTWRVDGPTIRLTFGRIASDPVEFRGAIDDEGRLVLESPSERCVLERSKPGAP